MSVTICLGLYFVFSVEILPMILVLYYEKGLSYIYELISKYLEYEGTIVSKYLDCDSTMLFNGQICKPFISSELCFFSTDTEFSSQVHGECKLPQLENSIYSPYISGVSESYTAYKPVARKVKPVPGVFPEDARVRRTIPEDPLLTLPQLPTHPPEFVSTSKLTRERLNVLV
jgi:hypothetical protein